MSKFYRAEILAIGTELLMGEITDTNSGFLASQLQTVGIEVTHINTLRDDRTELCEGIRQALARSSLVITSGGLGPTEYDMTRDCVAEVLGEKPYIDTAQEKELRGFFTRLGREMPADNLKQARLIPSATSIPNPHGTAPGWWVEKDGKIIILLPGPPRELQPMWQNQVKSSLQSKLPGGTILTRMLKTFGMGEAKVNELVKPLFLLGNPVLGIYAKTDGIHLRFIASGENAADLLVNAEKRSRDILGKYIWGIDEETLPAAVGSLLQERHLTLAVLEEGTGGNLAVTISNAPGSREWFGGSLVVSSGDARAHNGLETGINKKYGAISRQSAEAMAILVREKFGTDIGLSTTGITGMDGQGEKPGQLFIGLADGAGARSWLQENLPHRDIIRSRATVAALFHLREYLLNGNN